MAASKLTLSVERSGCFPASFKSRVKRTFDRMAEYVNDCVVPHIEELRAQNAEQAAQLVELRQEVQDLKQKLEKTGDPESSVERPKKRQKASDPEEDEHRKSDLESLRARFERLKQQCKQDRERTEYNLKQLNATSAGIIHAIFFRV
jgi:phage shock protein A